MIGPAVRALRDRVWPIRTRAATLARLPRTGRACCALSPRGQQISQFTILKEFATMAAVCDVCAKGPGFGKSVSHSHRRTNRRWNPNIQTVRAEVAPGNTRKVNVCTSCLKAGKVARG
ncbi:50S ribosomal protein L28 1 [Rhodococcus opacus PD630]|nr:50S ribosomal protein L28 1 [Rhodococcus opacus PD630]